MFLPFKRVVQLPENQLQYRLTKKLEAIREKSKEEVMGTFKLTKSMETGIEEIDEQHRTLLDWANSLSAANEEAGEQKVTETLNNLQDYVSYHFQTEEEAMDSYDYGKLEKHRKQHHRLMHEVSDLFSRTRGKENTKGALAEVEYLLTDWIQLHIKEWDQPFASFVKNRRR